LLGDAILKRIEILLAENQAWIIGVTLKRIWLEKCYDVGHVGSPLCLGWLQRDGIGHNQFRGFSPMLTKTGDIPLGVDATVGPARECRSGFGAPSVT
jgi:hypothetical protein